jgi:hypothetical protein
MVGDNQSNGDPMPSPDQIADNAFVKAIARVSMAASMPVIGIIVWLAGAWLDNRFEAQAAVSHSLGVRVDRLEDTTSNQSERVSTLERVIQDGRADRLAFQQEMRRDFKEVQSAVIAQSNSIAALTATLQTLIERERGRR